MIAWMVETALAVSLLMAMVLALRGPVARHFGAGWAYALWAVPALRLVLPPLPQPLLDLCLPPVASFIPTAAEMAAPLPADAGPGQWVPLMLALWAGGAVIFLTMQWLSYRAFLARLDGSSRPARPPVFGGIRTWISGAVDGPLALGVIERRIVLPTDFSRRYTPAERRLALEHELVHHRRGDIWFNIMGMVVLACLWWNPLAWIAFRAFRTDQELACDAAVARRASAEERCDYARALVKSASAPGLIAVSALNPADQLKRRLRMMRSHRAGGLRSAGGLAALSILAAAGFAVSASRPALERVAPQLAAAIPPAVDIAPPAPAPAPVAAAAAAPASNIVVTGRRPKPAPAPALASEPIRLASAEFGPADMRRLLARLPRVSVAPPHALPAPEPLPVRTAERVFRVKSDEAGKVQFVIVREALTVAQAAEVRAALARAVALSRGPDGKVREDSLRTHINDSADAFEFEIQTIVRGE